MTARALPERYRLARNLDEGYEVRWDCPEHNTEEWLRITSALHITAPVRVSSFDVEPVADGPSSCLGNGRFSANPDEHMFSRRPTPSATS